MEVTNGCGSSQEPPAYRRVLSCDGERTVRVHVSSPMGTATEQARPELLNLLGSGSFRQPFKGSYDSPSALALNQAAPVPARHNWRTHPFGLGRVRIDAWVDDPDPASNSSVTVCGSLMVGGKPAPDAKMVATWWFRSGPQKQSCVTDKAGIGRSCLPIGGANLKYGYDVPIRITATFEEKEYSAGTWFTRTPR
jgi:hypothetical protein